MADVIRITPEETYQKLRAGITLLACAYDSEQQFRNLRLEGAISFSELKSKLPALSKDEEIILYCA
jgi:hypothetical protein